MKRIPADQIGQRERQNSVVTCSKLLIQPPRTGSNIFKIILALETNVVSIPYSRIPAIDSRPLVYGYHHFLQGNSGIVHVYMASASFQILTVTSFKVDGSLHCPVSDCDWIVCHSGQRSVERSVRLCGHHLIYDLSLSQSTVYDPPGGSARWQPPPSPTAKNTHRV